MPKKSSKTENSLQEREQLEKLYIKQQLGAAAVAKKLGWGERTVYARLAFHGLISGHKRPNYCESCGHVVKGKRKA
jgi:hypothetical protein